MSGKDLPPDSSILVVRRTIDESAQRLFELWTQPAHLMKWWGPESVTCTDASVDLRPGGGYRIANLFPDGKTVWIAGEFEVVAPPHTLVYTWRIDSDPRPPERVTVRFEPREHATEVVVTHERIADAAAREQHEKGWQGCLDGLVEYLNLP